MTKSNKLMHRKLKDLVSVGPATLRDFKLLGITTVEQLKDHDAHSLYLQLINITGTHHDICMQDVFAAAIAQAQDPELPQEKCQWWYWSTIRKKLPSN